MEMNLQIIYNLVKQESIKWINLRTKKKKNLSLLNQALKGNKQDGANNLTDCVQRLQIKPRRN
jgi:hypothetical protein